jgi:hypothetical protein
VTNYVGERTEKKCKLRRIQPFVSVTGMVVHGHAWHGTWCMVFVVQEKIKSNEIRKKN